MIASSSGERRRNQRHRAPSIMYVQLGSGNGGIVLNLGIDGVAFHIAQRLTADKNSTLQLRLRGSGLNVDLVGELVWLSPTQKEAGICFKDVPGNVRRDIADWIAREAQVFEPVGLDDGSRSKPIPANSDLFETADTSVPQTLSEALSMPRPKLANPPLSADASANGLFSPVPLDYVPPMSFLPSLREVSSPNFERDAYDEEWDDNPDESDPDSTASSEPSRVEPQLRIRPLPEPAPLEDSHQPPAVNSSPFLLSLERMPAARVELSQASVEATSKSELRKTEEIEPTAVPPAVNSSPYLLSLKRISTARGELPQASLEAPGMNEFHGTEETDPVYDPPASLTSPFLRSLEQRSYARYDRMPVPAEPAGKIELRNTEEIAPAYHARVYRPPEQLATDAPVEKWIPPALLGAWSRADIQRKLALASSGVACLGIFALFLTMAVARTGSNTRGIEESVPLPEPTAQEFAAPSAAPTAGTNSLQIDPIQGPAALPVAVPRRTLRPRKSLLAIFIQALLRITPGGSDERARIRDDQLGVQVWTSKRNGYFYCTDSDFYKSVQPGAFMVQSDAIQSGYQPRIGQFCD
jgi:hypothetical protein